ncbi:MAG: hypothetical protein M1815_006256 [Lichina confinis]|nr:MAG: hypothetical protein M1815_006256 [Lichina confinis]
MPAIAASAPPCISASAASWAFASFPPDASFSGGVNPSLVFPTEGFPTNFVPVDNPSPVDDAPIVFKNADELPPMPEITGYGGDPTPETVVELSPGTDGDNAAEGDSGGVTGFFKRLFW